MSSEVKKNKKPFYKKWWVWGILIFVGVIMFGESDSSSLSEEQKELIEKEVSAYKNFTQKLLDIYDQYEEMWMTTSISDLNENQKFNESALNSIEEIANRLESYELTEEQKSIVNEYTAKLEEAVNDYEEFETELRNCLQSENGTCFLE